LFMSVGFLFKVSAAPFHFWSPERWSGKSSPNIQWSYMRAGKTGKLRGSPKAYDTKP
jgi:NADH:ubiquinone oxidoreductase subunit 2 (subunit N)